MKNTFFFVISLVALLTLDLLAQENVSYSGSYSLVTDHSNLPKPGSFEVVKVVEVYSISCVHCYRFSRSKAPFEKAFEGKIDVSHIDIGWMGPYFSRFLYLSEDYGKNEQTRNFLFSQMHERGNQNITNPELLDLYARYLKFPSSYKSDIAKEELGERVDERLAYAQKFDVRSTPTFIIEDAIIVKGNNVENLALVINSLLKEPADF